MTYTLVVEKWDARPETGYARWVPFKEEQVEGRETAKRIFVGTGSFRKVFDKETGKEIKARGFHSWFKHSLRIPNGQPAQPKEQVSA